MRTAADVCQSFSYLWVVGSIPTRLTTKIPKKIAAGRITQLGAIERLQPFPTSALVDFIVGLITPEW